MENENIEKQEFFKTYLGIKNKNVLSSLEQMAYVWKVKDKEVIIREGEPLPCVPFLVSGIVKGYCESKGDGKEHVSCFGYLKRRHCCRNFQFIRKCEITFDDRINQFVYHAVRPDTRIVEVD